MFHTIEARTVPSKSHHQPEQGTCQTLKSTENPIKTDVATETINYQAKNSKENENQVKNGNN